MGSTACNLLTMMRKIFNAGVYGECVLYQNLTVFNELIHSFFNSMQIVYVHTEFPIWKWMYGIVHNEWVVSVCRLMKRDLCWVWLVAYLTAHCTHRLIHAPLLINASSQKSKSFSLCMEFEGKIPYFMTNFDLCIIRI